MVAWNTREKRVAIVAGTRTPFAKMGGPLKNVHVTDLAKRTFERRCTARIGLRIGWTK